MGAPHWPVRRCQVMDKGKKVEEGKHEEIMKIPIKKDEDGQIIQGYYHNQVRAHTGLVLRWIVRTPASCCV